MLSFSLLVSWLVCKTANGAGKWCRITIPIQHLLPYTRPKGGGDSIIERVWVPSWEEDCYRDLTSCSILHGWRVSPAVSWEGWWKRKGTIGCKNVQWSHSLLWLSKQKRERMCTRARVVLLLVQLIQISNGIFYRSDCLLSGFMWVQNLAGLVCLFACLIRALLSKLQNPGLKWGLPRSMRTLLSKARALLGLGLTIVPWCLMIWFELAIKGWAMSCLFSSIVCWSLLGLLEISLI